MIGGSSRRSAAPATDVERAATGRLVDEAGTPAAGRRGATWRRDAGRRHERAWRSCGPDGGVGVHVSGRSDGRERSSCRRRRASSRCGSCAATSAGDASCGTGSLPGCCVRGRSARAASCAATSGGERSSGRRVRASVRCGSRSDARRAGRRFRCRCRAGPRRRIWIAMLSNGSKLCMATPKPTTAAITAQSTARSRCPSCGAARRGRGERGEQDPHHRSPAEDAVLRRAARCR